jgi:hypothetical protein
MTPTPEERLMAALGPVLDVLGLDAELRPQLIAAINTYATIRADAAEATLKEIRAQQKEDFVRAERAEAEVTRLRAALTRIEKWFGEFPPSGRCWEDGTWMSYGAAYGSNGERDYMRSIARAALLPFTDAPTAEPAR